MAPFTYAILFVYIYFLPIRFSLLGISLFLNLVTDVLHSLVTLPVREDLGLYWLQIGLGPWAGVRICSVRIRFKVMG